MFFTQDNGELGEAFAGIAGGHFFSEDPHVHLLPPAGLTLVNVQTSDTGMYYVKIEYFDQHGISFFHTVEKFARLEISGTVYFYSANLGTQ